MPADIRKIIVSVEDVLLEEGQAIEPPTRTALAIAVIANPFAGQYSADLEPLMEIGAELGGLLGKRCVAALGIAPGAAVSYGKGAIVGENGGLEHAAAILHPRLGKPLRTEVEKGDALIPSAKKRGGPGSTLDVPLGHKDDAWSRNHFSAIEARVTDAPRVDEILVAVAVTDFGRPLPRA